MQEFGNVADALLGGDFLDLVADGVFEARHVVPGAQHADGRRESRRLFHLGQHERVDRIAIFLVVDDQVAFADAVAELHDFEVEAVHADALVAILAEDERLAVFELDDVLAARFFLGQVEPGAVVEDVAILQDLNVGRAAMRRGLLEHFFEMPLHDVHRAGHESGLRSDGQRQRIERAGIGAVRSGLGLLAEFGSGGILPLGQAVNPVVEHEHLDAHVAAQHVNGVVAADRQGIAVTGGDPDFEVRVGQLDARGHGGRAPVNRVKAERIHVVREAAGAADARNHHEFFARDAQLRKYGLHRGQNGVVAATGAPADFLIGLKIFLGQNRHC